jgi:hypothetical protein
MALERLGVRVASNMAGRIVPCSVVAELHAALSNALASRFEDAALLRMVQRCDSLVARLASDASSTLFLFEDGPFTRAARQTAKVRGWGIVCVPLLRARWLASGIIVLLHRTADRWWNCGWS